MIVLMIFLSQYFSLCCWLAAMLTRLGYSALCCTAGPLLPRPSLVTARSSLVHFSPPGPWLAPGRAPVLHSLLPGPGTQGWVAREGPALSSGRLAWIHNYGTITLPSGRTLTTYLVEYDMECRRLKICLWQDGIWNMDEKWPQTS